MDLVKNERIVKTNRIKKKNGIIKKAPRIIGIVKYIKWKIWAYDKRS